MLHSLSISNYIIIERSEVLFAPGLNMITGETGAGKSILLGAIGLILGRRADTQVLLDPENKTVIEAFFVDKEERVSSILRAYDLDENREIVLRREISPNGRSRAFINDTPATLDTMTEVGAALMDVHQQFETLEIQQVKEQYHILDAWCGLQQKRQQYQQDYEKYTGIKARLQSLREQQARAIKEKDYLHFQLEEFETMQIESGGISGMEEEFRLQTDAEEIKTALAELIESITGERGITDQLRIHARNLSRFAQSNAEMKKFAQRLQTFIEECDDLCKEINHFEEDIEPDPRRRQLLEERLNAINKIMLKHGARNAEELKGIQHKLETDLAKWKNLDSEILHQEEQMVALRQSLDNQAAMLSTARRKGAPKFSERISKGLHELAMKHAVLSIAVSQSVELHTYGGDDIEFLFAPNLGSELRPVKKVASGGELSRLNLCLKSEVSDKMELPTLVFDEIDAGVSGEIALRMGQKLKTLAQKHQVIMITHSPQIAAQAGHHLQVTKSEKRGRSVAQIKALPPEERITEIAKMLSGDPPTHAAILNAKTLIQT